KWQLAEMGDASYLQTSAFDFYSQYYSGLMSSETGDAASAIELLSSAALNDKSVLPENNRELIRNYAQAGFPFAALKLAASDTSDMPDDLLELLSRSAEKVEDYQKAIDFEM